jgi:hypothetical protein
MVNLNSTPYFEVLYDFCPECEKLMLYDFERQMIDLPALPLWRLKTPKLLPRIRA